VAFCFFFAKKLCFREDPGFPDKCPPKFPK